MTNANAPAKREGFAFFRVRLSAAELAALDAALEAMPVRASRTAGLHAAVRRGLPLLAAPTAASVVAPTRAA